MILLTGGSGFIGGHFHNYLTSTDLINLDLEEPKFAHSAKYIKGDIRIEEDVRRAFEGYKVTRIISLAAKHHDFGIGHDEYFDTNEDGTRILCKVATEYGVKELVFFSSVAVYGLREKISTEEMTPEPDSPYGKSKLAGEKVLEKWAMEDRTRKVLIIRPTVVFGPGNLANMYSLIRQIDSGLYFHLGKGNNLKSIAYVENLVSATLFLIDKGWGPGVTIYNYADEPHLSSKQIAEVIAGALRKKIRLTVPLWMGILAGIPFDIAIKLTGKNLPISTSRIKKLATQTLHSAQKLFSKGYQPSFSTDQGLVRMVEWYKTKKTDKLSGNI